MSTGAVPENRPASRFGSSRAFASCAAPSSASNTGSARDELVPGGLTQEEGLEFAKLIEDHVDLLPRLVRDHGRDCG